MSPESASSVNKNETSQDHESASPISPLRVAVQGLREVLSKRQEVVDEARDVYASLVPVEDHPSTNLVWDEANKTWNEVPAVQTVKHRKFDPKLAPQTLRERRGVARVGRKISKARDIQSTRQYRMKVVWGEDIGTEEFKERVTREILDPLERRRALKANKKYQKLTRKAGRLYGE